MQRLLPRGRSGFLWQAWLFYCLLFASPAHAQLPGLGMPADNPLPAGVKRVGLLETAYVEFEGLPKFELASPLIADREKPGKDTPVEVRTRKVETELKAVLESLLIQDQGQPYGEQTPLEAGQVKIEARSEKGAVALGIYGNGISIANPLMFVTASDVEYHGKSPETVAEEWRKTLTDALNTAVRARRPEAVQSRWTALRTTVLIVLASYALLFGLNRLLLRRQNQLRVEIANHQTAENAVVDAEKGTEPAEPATALTLESRFKLLAFLRWLLFWLMLTVWIGGAGFAMALFPQTRKFALYLTATPLIALIALFVAGLVNRVTDMMVDRSIASWQTNQLFEGMDATHITARIATISGAIRALKLVLIYSIALIWVLSQLDVVPWSVVTIGAIVALAVSFAAQSLVKDVVMGVLILMEDQYAIGDSVSILGTSGTVEYMNLRITQIRTSDGTLVTLPNNAITKVENFSRHWSSITVEFEVPPSANANAMLESVQNISQEMAEEPEWKDIITDAHQWSGVTAISRAAMTISICVKTKPLQQHAVGRELRRRIKSFLDAEAIDLRAALVVSTE